MKIRPIFLALCIVTTLPLQAAPPGKRQDAASRAGFFISQFTYGAVERCKSASPESSRSYQIQLDRLKELHTPLLQTVVESADYARYRLELDRVGTSLPQDTQSATRDCDAFAYLLKASLDTPEGREVLENYSRTLLP